jgi:hypothetical protein
MAEIPENVQSGFDSEYEALQEARQRIEQSTELSQGEREMALGRIAQREMEHVRRVQAEAGRAEENETLGRKLETARAQGGVGLHHTPDGGVQVQHQTPDPSVSPYLERPEVAEQRNRLTTVTADLTEARQAIASNPNLPESERTRMLAVIDERIQAHQNPPPAALARPGVPTAPGTALAPTDPRGTVDASTVAGTPRPRGTRAAAPATPAAPPPKGAPYQDPYDPGSLYTDTGPVSEIRRSFGEQGKIEQQAGLDSAADVMAAAEQIRAQKDAAYQRMREDLVSQDRMLRELDVQLGQLRSMQFDGERLFRNGHGVSLALGIAVGAMQQTLNNVLFPGSNAPNTAMALVNDAIERDLQEQSVNFQQGVTTLGMGRTAYSMARELGMDHVAAYEYAAASAQDYVARQLNARRLTMGAGVAAQQALRAEQELRMSAMDRREDALRMGAQQMVARQGGGGAAQRGRGGHPIAAMTFVRPGVDITELTKRLTPSRMNDLVDTMMGASNVIRIVDQINALLTETNGGQNFGTAARGRMSSLAGQLSNAIRQASGMGALDNGAITLTQQIAGDPLALTETLPVLRGRLQELRASTHATAREYVQYVGMGDLVFDENARTTLVQPRPSAPGMTSEEGNAQGAGAPASGPFATLGRDVVNNHEGAWRSFAQWAVGSEEERRSPGFQVTGPPAGPSPVERAMSSAVSSEESE